jgi:hypothetical protein
MLSYLVLIFYFYTLLNFSIAAKLRYVPYLILACMCTMHMCHFMAWAMLMPHAMMYIYFRIELLLNLIQYLLFDMHTPYLAKVNTLSLTIYYAVETKKLISRAIRYVWHYIHTSYIISNLDAWQTNTHLRQRKI